MAHLWIMLRHKAHVVCSHGRSDCLLLLKLYINPPLVQNSDVYPLRIISLEHSFVHLCDGQKLKYLGDGHHGHQYIGDII